MSDSKEVAVMAGVEVAKLLLQGYFTYVKHQNLTNEQTLALFEQAQSDFNKNDPSKLEDV